jgi:hypothetical protein
MKRLSAMLSLLILASASIAAASAPAQEDRGRPVLELGSNKIEVNHGKPGLRGRNPEALIQPGLVWRMGANDPTTLSTQASLKFGEKVIPAGKYILQAKLVAAQKWHLLIQSEDGSSIADVPFNLQKGDKSVEYLTITLEKKDKGGRLVMQWGTFVLAADFQPAAMTASAEAGQSDKWPEMSAFHDVMSATFHPMEEGDLKPIRSRAQDMAVKAMQWANSTPPAIYDQPKIKVNLRKLSNESIHLAARIVDKASDEQVKELLTALHDRFHEIAGMCRDAKKANQ